MDADKTDIVDLLRESPCGNKCKFSVAFEAADEIERLRALLRDRDGGVHDQDCGLIMQHLYRPCRCGHEEVAEYFAALGKAGE